ncbi:MAG: hypothetical protein ACC645_04655 [Pirellulales bacterium]
MKTHINLLPMAYRRRQLILLRLRQWSVVWGVAILAMAGVGWSQWSKFQADAARLTALKSEYAPVHTMEEKAKELEQRIQELRHRETLVLSLAGEQSMLTLVGMLSQAVRNCDRQVCIRVLNLRRTDPQSTGSDNVLALDGIATDDASVARFADSLRDFDAFRRVDLQSTGTTEIVVQGDTVEARTYRMECVF